MMPGETHSAAPGTAADLSRCQGCASLQQNLNEYVEALITLKQKIINTDNLLTEYQKKCDELQFARRENSTLHHQVEQMLQKISPLQKCQEELGSLKAELEEKKSSLKLYQDTHQEYTRVKEECLKSDAQKKKLEAKVKKLEEAAVRQTQDFKQLSNEKKILEKEFKKTQEKLDEFSKQKNEKELRHIGTQISSDSYGSIDKRKVKLLLKELWLCVNTAHRLPGEGGRWVLGDTAHRLPGEGSRWVLEQPAGDSTRCKASGEGGALPPAQSGPLRTPDGQACLADLSMELEGDFSSHENVETERPSGADDSADHAFHKDRNPEVSVQSAADGGGTAGSDQEHWLDEDLQAAIDFFKLPPPLLSPVPSPPLMSSPPLGSLTSPLAPETYFGEYTDSSDNDTAQPRTSAESVSEDDTAEPRDYFGLSRKSTGSGTWEEKPKSQEVCRVTAAGPETPAAAPREPSAVPCERWTPSSDFTAGRERDISDGAETQMEVRELERSVQTEEPLPKPTRTVWVEKLSSNPEREKQAAPGKSAPCSSPLGKRPLKELTETEQKTLLSKGIGSPKSEFTKWAVPEDVAPQSDSVALSDHFQGLSGEAAKARNSVHGSIMGESSEPEDSHADYTVDASRPDAGANFSSSSTSVVLSVSRNPQSCPFQLVSDTDTPTKVLPAKLGPSEQKLQPETLNTLHLQSEQAERPGGGRDLGRGSRALSPAWGASDVNDPKNSARECTKIINSMTNVCSFPHSVFMKATKDGQCESQDPRIELMLPKSGFTSVIDSRADSVKSASGFVKSTSWHHSDLLRRRGEEILKAKLEHEQKTDHQLQKGIPSVQNRGATSNLELPGENTNPVEFKPTASLLPNQVSVIMKQSRPEKGQGAKLEPLRLHRSEPALGAERSDRETDRTAPVAKCTAEGAGIALSIQEASVRSTSPEVSTSWRKSDCDSPGGSLPVESVGCSTNRTLSFSSENIPVRTQDVVREAAVQGEVQNNRPFPQTTDPDSSGVEGSGLPPASASAAPGGFPVEETLCGEAARSGSEALAVAKDSPGTPPNARGLLKSPSKARGALPECLVTAGSAASSAFSRKDEEAPDAAPSSFPGTLYSYTGIREGGEDDTEVEESEAFSCSEGEQDPEAVVGSTQQDAPDASQRGAGAAEPGAAEAGPSVEVGRLTSALQDCNISAFPDIDRLSTSEVVLFLESCQLKDYNSGDSVSECSSKGTLHKEVNKELKQSALSGGEAREGPCEEAALGASEEWVESEDEGESLKNASQLAPCSLETLSDVLTKIGQELQINYEGCQDHSGNLFLNINSSLTTEKLEGKVPSQEVASSSSRAPELLPLLASVGARSSSPVPDGSRERIQSRPEEARQADGGEAALCPASAAEPTTEQSSREAETTFQCQISTVTSEVINVLINKDQNLVIEKGDNWTIISGVSVGPDVDQVIVCATPEDPAPRDPGELEAESISEASVEKSPDTDAAGPACREPLCGSTLPCEDVSSSGQSANFDKSRLRNRPVKPSIWISSQIYDQTFETQVAASDHTYYNSKLEPCGKNKNRSKIANKEPSNKPAKTLASNKVETHPSEVSQSCSGERSNVKTPRNQTQPVLANADTSTPTECSPDTLSKIRQEVGPPLPPLLAPLVATPPRTSQPLSPLISSSSPSSPASPVGQISPLCDTPAPPVLSPWLEDPRHISPPGPSPSPSPSAASAGERVVSSPLQFCAATPKHALPVPGRLPACAPSHTAVGAPPQENSVKILDTMYPELSARARTLNLLKGNIQRARGASADSKNLPGSVSALLGFKAITSASTAFVKAGGSSAGDARQEKSRASGAQQDAGGKRTLSTCTPRSAKRLRLGSGSPEPESRESSAGVHRSLQRNLPQAEAGATEEESSSVRAVNTESRLPSKPKETVESHDKAIADALKKIAESSFDLLPVIRSHVYVGNISKKPVMRDQEKEVVYEFSTTKKHLAECLLHSILSELKIQKTSLDHSYIHALCRVYVGICRQLGDLERARLFCYSLLKEDFPESEKLTLFIANMWHDIFLSQSVINKAMQLVARQRAKGEVLNCLRAFLNWEKNAPVDVGFMVSKLLLTIQLCPKTEFQSSEKFGEDLNDHTWEYIFAIDLLCCHQKWIWTHDNIISKELWPVMDKWIKHRKGHANIAHTPDVIIASVLRLIGRLGQLGLKEGFPSAVKNISSVIGMFIQHAQDEDIPWGVQLAAVYALCDLSPSNPAEIAKILDAWRREASSSIPSAVASYLEEVSSLSAEGLG
ncbi:little elongation complex subunit 1 [Oryctolagus cuniculus]|uniref:little elongation complex subunit 1 n=1 Tax=Oryctolagus cuniculus TaxID=9986 RepID=UPI0038799512